MRGEDSALIHSILTFCQNRLRYILTIKWQLHKILVNHQLTKEVHSSVLDIFEFCGCMGWTGLKVHTPNWILPKMDFFGELITALTRLRF